MYVKHKKVKLSLKAIAMNATFIPCLKSIITISISKNIVMQCANFNNGIVFESIFLLAFFGNLRLASIAPVSSSKFSYKW